MIQVHKNTTLWGITRKNMASIYIYIYVTVYVNSYSCTSLWIWQSTYIITLYIHVHVYMQYESGILHDAWYCMLTQLWCAAYKQCFSSLITLPTHCFPLNVYVRKIIWSLKWHAEKYMFNNWCSHPIYAWMLTGVCQAIRIFYPCFFHVFISTGILENDLILPWSTIHWTCTWWCTCTCRFHILFINV